jgi:hypothetical protein
MLTTIFNLLYHFWTTTLFPSSSNALLGGHAASSPLPVQAVPGLMTLLDVALYRSVEGQLTGLVCTAHALLAAWLDLKIQAAVVLKAAKYELSDLGVIISSSSSSSSSTTSSSAASSSSSSSSSLLLLQSSRPALMESFARACFDAACDAIERITTDRLAISANLSDPYESGSSSSSSATAGAGPSSSATPASSSLGDRSSSGAGGVAGLPPTSVGGGGGGGTTDLLVAALQDSSLDTGRRDPTLQRPRDCWETSRLLCPDYVWADDVCSYCQRLLRQLSKHAYVIAEQNNSSNGILEAPGAFLGGDVFATRQSAPRGRRVPPSSSSSGYTDRHATLLLQLLQTDINCRLLQFRAAVEAESVVAKRLYLVKCEYRAPFRAFLEAHQSVQRAPSLTLVQEYTTTNSSNSNKIVEERRVPAQARLQKLLETPELVETLALERQIELFEVEMAKALYPFCELARYLDYKRASLKPFAVPASSSSSILANKDDVNNNNIATNGDLMVELQETLHRLKRCLSSRSKTASSSSSSQQHHDASGGIRPLLLDLQGVPRDEELLLQKHYDDVVRNNVMVQNNSKYREAVYCKRLDRLIRHLRILAKLTERRNFFRSTDNSNTKASSSSSSSAAASVIDIPSSLVRGCMTLDHELLRCQAQDWYTMTVRQVELATSKNLELLAEQIRTAEVQKSLAVATASSLDVVRQRLEVIHADCEKRFEVLKETIEEVCWREMNLFVQLSAPEPHQVLVLPENTSAIGVFGRPLQMAGERLPIG